MASAAIRRERHALIQINADRRFSTYLGQLLDLIDMLMPVATGGDRGWSLVEDNGDEGCER